MPNETVFSDVFSGPYPNVELLCAPTEQDWMEVKRRALVTIGKAPVKAPSLEWKKSILRARHSPIRWLRFSFLITCPSYVSVHFCRHVHAQPYVSSQRNDRQTAYDRTKAPQNAPVAMILDVNGEELMTIMNKRLCNLADPVTRNIAAMMRRVVLEHNPEFEDELVPNCVLYGQCREMNSCH